jgi:hypothetical protein
MRNNGVDVGWAGCWRGVIAEAGPEWFVSCFDSLTGFVSLVSFFASHRIHHEQAAGDPGQVSRSDTTNQADLAGSQMSQSSG